jgi:hypothetical protein
VIGWRVVEALLAPRILNSASNQGARKASTTCHPSDIVILKFQSKCHSTDVARLILSAIYERIKKQPVRNSAQAVFLIH